MPTKRRCFVAMTFAGLVMFTQALTVVLRQITRSPAWAWLSPEDTLDVLADAIFRTGATPAIPIGAAAAVVLVLIALSVLVLERRVRGVEVVT